MKNNAKTLAIVFTLGAILLAWRPANAITPPATQYMGPTGITALIAGTRIFTVKSVEKGSPADGKLWPGDQVVGAGRIPFLKRVRFEFAAAIAQARTEKNKGKLVLMVRRKNGGRKMHRVTLQLGVVGPDTFNDTAPYNCPKTDALITEAAEHIASKRAYGGLGVGLLGLLATGEEKYIKHVRDHLHKEKQPEDTNVLINTSGGYVAWRWGYKMLVLTEYYLLTGDKYVLPAIRMYAEGIASGQDAAGLWGHQMATSRSLGRAHGYGVMNQPTMPLFISLILAKKCGIDSPRITAAIARTTNHYVSIYMHKGSMGYGNHGPHNRSCYNNNGSSASLAVALAAAGHVEGARFFARMSMAGYNGMESGHATYFFNLMWTGLGANIAGPDAMAAFFKKASWLIPMNLNWKGGYTYRSSEGESLGNTGSYLLNLCTSRRKIHITGKGVDPKIVLNAKEIKETMDVHKYVNKLIPMNIDQLMEVIDTHWSPIIRRTATWKLLKFKLQDVEATARKRMKAKRNALALTGVSRLWDKTPGIFDEVATIMRDRSASIELRAAAASVLGSAAWARYIEPTEKFGRAEFYGGGQLHKPSLKYFPDLVKVIADDEDNDPRGILDRAAGGALSNLGNPYTQNLITDKSLFYKAINKMLADKDNAGIRAGAMALIAAKMPLEDFHYVADMVVHVSLGTDPEYTVYRGCSQGTENGVGLLKRLNIQEAAEILIDSFPTATRCKERARRMALLGSFGANAKPYLPRLKAALEKFNPDPKAEKSAGFTKDIPLHKHIIEELIQTIENATDPPKKTITLKEAIQFGLDAQKRKTKQ